MDLALLALDVRGSVTTESADKSGFSPMVFAQAPRLARNSGRALGVRCQFTLRLACTHTIDMRFKGFGSLAGGLLPRLSEAQTHRCDP